jgi:hypothetical protein
MRHLFYIFLLTITGVFTMSMHKATPSSKDIEKLKYWKNAIRYEIIKKYTEKYNLVVGGISDGMPGGIMHEIGVMFDRYQVTSKAKARQIIVECVLDFLEKINSCEEIQPYLRDRPFTVENIDITLIMFNPDRTNIFYPNIRTVNTRRDKIIYKTYKPERPNNSIEEEELFEDAVQLAKTEIPPEDLS